MICTHGQKINAFLKTSHLGLTISDVPERYTDVLKNDHCTARTGISGGI
jgi:hypothetical protein